MGWKRKRISRREKEYGTRGTGSEKSTRMGKREKGTAEKRERTWKISVDMRNIENGWTVGT